MVAKPEKLLYSVAKCADDELINAKDAIKGNDYFCPVCNSELILRKSGNTGKNSKRPHFAHKTITPNCTPETALHHTFKTLAFRKISASLKDKNALSFQWVCEFCTENHSGDLLKKISDVKLEHNLGKCQPDIALFDERGNVFAVIEVVVTHKIEEQALSYYKDNEIIVIEYVLTSDLDLVNVEDRLSKPDSVNICYNPKCEQCGNYLIKLYLYTNSSQCCRCGSELKYSYIKSQVDGFVRGHGTYQGPDDFKAEEISMARSKGVILKKHFSKMAGYSYLANTCNTCNAFIGDHYLFTQYIAPDQYGEIEKNKVFIEYQCGECLTKSFDE